MPCERSEKGMEFIMDRNVEKFIERKDERKNSANAKLKLLVYGVKDNPEIFKKYQSFFKEEHYALIMKF